MQIDKAYLSIYNMAQVLGLPILPFLCLYGISKKKYRKQFLMRLGVKNQCLQGPGPRIWVHAMSLGEYQAARPLLRALPKAIPQAKIIVSATTRSGLDAMSQDKECPRELTTALPYDFFPVVTKVVRDLKPDCFILIETDIWPNLLYTLRRYGCKTMLANGSISSRAASRLKKLPGAAQFLYGNFSCIAMQSQDDANRLKHLGIDSSRVVVPGNMKFDISPPEITEEEKKHLLKLTGFDRSMRIICCGSTHEPEEEILLRTYEKLKGKHDLGLIIAPRNVERAQGIEMLCKSMNLTAHRRSKGAPRTPYQVFILDTLGELLKFYSICHIAFVGGTFSPVGGHNLLEPVYFSRPVLFGPHVESCREMAQALIQAEAGIGLETPEELTHQMDSILSDSNKYEELKRAAASFLKAHKGVTQRYVELIKGLLDKD